jgi:hypothetical protein
MIETVAFVWKADAEHAWWLNSGVLARERWDDLGINRFQFKSSLITGQWMAARAFTPLQLGCNALCGMYLRYHDLKSATEQYGDKWEKHLCSRVTLRNIIFNAANMFERVLRHPGGPFAPDKTTEAVSEQHYSRTKVMTRAFNAFRRFLRSISLQTRKQCRKLIHKLFLNASECYRGF